MRRALVLMALVLAGCGDEESEPIQPTETTEENLENSVPPSSTTTQP